MRVVLCMAQQAPFVVDLMDSVEVTVPTVTWLKRRMLWCCTEDVVSAIFVQDSLHVDSLRMPGLDLSEEKKPPSETLELHPGKYLSLS